MNTATNPGVETVDSGATLLDETHAVLTGYVAMPSPEVADAAVLWVAMTHAIPAFEAAPRLAISSPMKRCGKTRLLDILTGICHDPLVSVNATVAAIYRSLSTDHPPTLIIDEADTIWGTKRQSEQNEDLRALLNAGFQRGKPVLRCVGPESKPVQFPTFAPAALAGIGKLPDTITDRAITVTMRRRTPHETVLPFRSRRDGPRLSQLRSQLAAWSAAHVDRMQQLVPAMPLEDREADTWEPLIIVADTAGGTWPDRARIAALRLTQQAAAGDREQSLELRLIADIRDAFNTYHAEFVPSTELVARLTGIDDAPWAELKLKPRGLSDRLRDFGITPKSNGTKRGYQRSDFSDIFDRYLTTSKGENTRGETSPTVKASKPQLEALTVPAAFTDQPSTVARADTSNRQPQQTVNPLSSSFDGLTVGDTTVADNHRKEQPHRATAHQ